jgi:hypothetical protein
VEWFNEPSKWSLEDGEIVVQSDPQTDFWCVTGYGYVRDNGHIYGETLSSDFYLAVKVKAEYKKQYDQAGAAVRVDERHWIKTGVELFEGKLRFSVVVTADNSSWVISDLPQDFSVLNLALARRGDALEISYATDQNTMAMAAVVYLEPNALALAGVMCASPEGDGLAAQFTEFELHAC